MMKLILSLALCFTALTSFAQPNPVPLPRHRFTVIAHRGDHVSYPENTLASYEQAIKHGADYVEIDIRTTKDGQLVSLHNESVDRMTNGTGLVKNLTLAEIKKLKVKTDDKLKDESFTIPAFEEILTLCKDKIYIYIDFKEADPAVVYPILTKYKMEKQVLIYINKPIQFTQWRKAAPQMPLMLSMPDNLKDTTAMAAFINQYHPDVLDGNYTQYNTLLINLAQSNHIPVWPDGQSSSEGEKIWDEAIAKGLTGLQTDHPETFVNYLTKKELR